jgi:hypothetical protein
MGDQILAQANMVDYTQYVTDPLYAAPDQYWYVLAAAFEAVLLTSLADRLLATCLALLPFRKDVYAHHWMHPIAGSNASSGSGSGSGGSASLPFTAEGKP